MKNYIIPLFIPHYGCRQACVFCNQHKITGAAATDATPHSVRAEIAAHLARIDRPRRIEAAFYGGSFTALPPALQEALLTPARDFLRRGEIHAIRLSTRPDCIDAPTLARLRAYGVATVEIGAQSFDDAVLAAAGRGHTARDIFAAAEQIRAGGFALGLQLMLGLPGETWRTVMRSLRGTVRARPDFVRIYPTLVLQGTALAEQYARGLYAPLSRQAAIAYSMVMKSVFATEGIDVIRVGLQSSRQLDDPRVVLAGPYHPAFGEMVDAYAYRLAVARLLEQLPAAGREIQLHHHAAEASQLRGNRKENVRFWLERYRLRRIVFLPDHDARGTAALVCGGRRYLIFRDAAGHI